MVMQKWALLRDMERQQVAMCDADMGGATDFKMGVQNRTRERSERKKILYPHFFKCGGASKQISVGAY